MTHVAASACAPDPAVTAGVENFHEHFSVFCFTNDPRPRPRTGDLGTARARITTRGCWLGGRRRWSLAARSLRLPPRSLPALRTEDQAFVFARCSSTAMSVLAFSPMPFNSKRVDVVVGTDAAAFGKDLSASVAAWRADGTVAVWISCPALAADCVVAAAGLGFTYHHAEGDQAMLSLWLSTESESKIPTFATHTVGVGGFVLNGKGEVLVVKEKASGPRAQYKLPGGMADLGEDLGECASREVYEETGVKTEFDTLVGFRHRHNEGIGGRSNIYFVVLLRPSGSTEIVMDESELS